MTRAILLLLSVGLLAASTQAALRRMCYYTNWAQYRNGVGKYYPENVDPRLCTHIIYAFAKMNGNHLAAFEWNDESTPWMKGMYARFYAIKSQNPSVKLLLAVGGWNMASAPFTRMVATATGRQQFASTTVAFLRKNNFDGLDMDWEYPANRGSPAGDKRKFTLVLQELHNTFARESVPAGKERLLLSAAVPAGKDNIDSGYEIPEISRYLDFFNLMTYDLHGSWEDHTGHHSALYSKSTETGDDALLNVDWVTKYWVQKGAPKDKINVGIPLYGRSLKLPSGHTDESIGAKASGAGAAGQHTREAGFLAYYEICELMTQGATTHYDTEQMVPYLVKGDLWAGYEDPHSVKLKVDYIKQHGFGGVMVWALDLDDFTGMCGQGKYPLMNAIVSELSANAPVVQPVAGFVPITHPPATQAPVTQAPVTQAPVTQAPFTVAPWNPWTQHPIATNPPQTQTPVTFAPALSGTYHQMTRVPSSEFDCRSRRDGYYPSPRSCSSYYICAATFTFRTDCHSSLAFNPTTLFCDFPEHVNCNRFQPIGLLPQATNAPVTNAPYTNPPATYPPATYPPRTNPPRTNPPHTNPPVTYPPVVNHPTQPPPQGHFVCSNKQNGYYADPLDCTSFYMCSFGVSYHQHCPAGTKFSRTMGSCDTAGNVHC